MEEALEAGGDGQGGRVGGVAVDGAVVDVDFLLFIEDHVKPARLGPDVVVFRLVQSQCQFDAFLSENTQVHDPRGPSRVRPQFFSQDGFGVVGHPDLNFDFPFHGIPY